MRRSDPPAAASISPTGTSPSRFAGSEIAQRYPEGAHVTVTTRDGRSYEHFNGFARGTTAKPLSDEEIADKFMSCAAKPLGEQGARVLLAKVRSLETLPYARSLFRS